MKLTAVQSSQINAIGYAAATKTMQIEFKNGGLYEYANVPPEVFEEFAKAPSIGSHFYKHIKPFAEKYPYVKLEANKAVDAPAPEPTTDAVVRPQEPVMPDPVPPPPGVTQATEGSVSTVLAGMREDDEAASEAASKAALEDAPVEEHEQPGGGGL